MKPTLVASLILIGSVGGLSAAEYTWNQAPGETWQNWSDPANWLVDGTTATAAPGAEDTIKQPIATSGSIWRWDLGGGGYTVGALSFTDNWGINDTYAFRNGSLTVSSKANLLQKAKVIVSSGATLSLYNAEIGVNWNDGWNRCQFSVKDGGVVEIHGNNFLPRCVEFNIEEGGSWLYGKDAVLRNCNKNYLWILNNQGTATFENGLCKFNGTWSAPWKICQLAGEMIWGGAFDTEHNLYYQIELTGGKVSATGDVSFKYNANYPTYCKFTDGADLDIEVADGKTLDLTPFTYDGTATIRKTGAGTLKLADVPTAISMKGGPVTFAANTRTAMTSLEIGDGQSFTVANKNTTIDELVAVDGSLTLAVAGLNVKAYATDAVLGTIEVTKTAFKVGDVLLFSPSATLRAAVKAAAEAVEMNVDEDGETLTVGESAYIFNSTTATDLADPTGWKSGTRPPTGVNVTISGEGVKAIGTDATLAMFKSVTVANGAALSIQGEVTLPVTIALESTASLTIESGATVTLSELSTLLDDTLDPATTLPKFTIAADSTVVVPDAMKFKNVALTINGTLAVDGASVYLGYAAAGETSYFELTADGGKILPKTDPDTTGMAYYYVVPEVGGCVNVPSGVIHINNMPKESFAQGTANSATMTLKTPTCVYMGATNANRQNDKSMSIEICLDNTTLFTINNGDDWNATPKMLGCVGGGVTLRLKKDSAYRTWMYDNVRGGRNGRCGTFGLFGNARIIMEEGSRFIVPIDCDGANEFSPDTEREVLTVHNAYLHLHKTKGNGKAIIRMTGADNVVEANAPYWYNQANGCDLFAGVKELNLEGSDAKVTVVTWSQGENGFTGRIFNSGAVVTGEGSVVIGSTETDKGEYTHSWYHNLTALFGTSGNTCSGTLSTGSDKTRIAFLNGADWLGTVVSDGRISLGNPSLTTDSAAVTFGKVKLTEALPLRVWREEDGSNKSDTITLKEGFIVEEGDAGIVELVPQEGFELKSGEEVTLGTFPTGAFANVAVKCGKRSLKVVEYSTETEGVVVCKAKISSGFRIIIR